MHLSAKQNKKNSYLKFTKFLFSLNYFSGLIKIKITFLFYIKI